MIQTPERIDATSFLFYFSGSPAGNPVFAVSCLDVGDPRFDAVDPDAIVVHRYSWSITDRVLRIYLNEHDLGEDPDVWDASLTVDNLRTLAPLFDEVKFFHGAARARFYTAGEAWPFVEDENGDPACCCFEVVRQKEG